MAGITAGITQGAPTGADDVAFDPRARGVTGLVVRGFLLSLVTFGIYRFWYVTALRRFFWSRTEVAGSAPEYVGRGRELLLGFLVALVLLVPVYAVLFGLTVLVPALAPVSGPLSFVVLFLFGQYALYRGRRYRASRTLWRGIRLGQDGSALAYAARAAGWWLLTLLSLGLAFPWMRASLERYRVGHTLLGQGRLASTARAGQVLGPYLVLYLVGLGPVLVSVLALLVAAKFALPAPLIPDPGGKPGALMLDPAYRDGALALYGGAVVACACVFLPLALLLIPYYRARETRAFMSVVSLGGARLACTLRARQFYWPYLVYLLSVIGLTLLLGLAVAVGAVLVARGGGQVGDAAALALGVGTVAVYLVLLLAFAVLHVRVIVVRLWHAVASTTRIENASALDGVLASARRAGSGLNEGLADALDVGGALGVGF